MSVVDPAQTALALLHEALGNTRYPIMLKAFRQLCSGPHNGARAMVYVRLGRYLHLQGRHRLAKRVQNRLRKDFGCYISLKADIGPRLKLPHPIGVVIGDGARIGSDCVIFQHVTIGGGRLGDGARSLYPEIHSGVTIYAGACICGAIEVGNRATIAANAAVISAVPEGALAAGVPAQMKQRPSISLD